MNTKPSVSDSRHSDRLTSARMRVLTFLYENPEECELAPIHEHLGGHPNNARHLLAALEAEGYVHSRNQPQGRGRPVKLYSLSPHGKAYCTDRARSEAYEELLTLLLSRLTPGEAEQIGKAWATGKAAGLANGVGDITTHLAKRGFSPRVTSESTILLRSCPLITGEDAPSDAVRAMCKLHAGYISTLSAGQYELLPFARSGQCLLASKAAN